MLSPRQITVKNVNKLLHNTLHTFERHFLMMKIILMKKQNHRDVRDWPRLQTQVFWLQIQALSFLPHCTNSQRHQAVWSQTGLRFQDTWMNLQYLLPQHLPVIFQCIGTHPYIIALVWEVYQWQPYTLLPLPSHPLKVTKINITWSVLKTLFGRIFNFTTVLPKIQL